MIMQWHPWNFVLIRFRNNKNKWFIDANGNAYFNHICDKLIISVWFRSQHSVQSDLRNYLLNSAHLSTFIAQ